MRISRQYISFFIILFIFIGLGCSLISISDFKGSYSLEFFILLASYFLVGSMYLWAIVRHNLMIFEPIVLVFLLLICIFSITPIVLLSQGKTSIYGISFMGGCKRATFIYIFSCYSFYFGYYRKKYLKQRKYDINLEKNVKNKRKILKICFIVWIVCYLIALVYEVVFLGRSVIYILTFGAKGSIGMQSESSVAFLINFAYSLIIPWLYILYLSKSWLLKFIITFLMLNLYIICGWRFIIMIMILSLGCLYYLNKNRSPKKITIFTSIIATLLVFSLIGSIRHSLRNDIDMEWNLFDIEQIYFTLESNFNIYQPFYAVVEDYPSKYSYTYGEGMIYDTLITFIPRFIWPQKPLARDFASLRAIRYSLGDSVIDRAAMAMPNIGEYYVDFGVIGCIVIMFLFGRILGECTRLFLSPNRKFENLVLYSVIYAIVFQFITRGYMPNNFYLAIFMFWPHIIIKRNLRNKIS